MSDPTTAPTPASETYLANCHCGALRLRFKLSPPLYAPSATQETDPKENEPKEHPQTTTTRCDCSICLRNGYLLVYPFARDVEWLQTGEESDKSLKHYRFGSTLVPHAFCANCGGSMGMNVGGMKEYFGGEEKWAINVRMVKDVQLDKLKYKNVHGSEIKPGYTSPF